MSTCVNKMREKGLRNSSVPAELHQREASSETLFAKWTISLEAPRPHVCMFRNLCTYINSFITRCQYLSVGLITYGYIWLQLCFTASVYAAAGGAWREEWRLQVRRLSFQDFLNKIQGTASMKQQRWCDRAVFSEEKTWYKQLEKFILAHLLDPFTCIHGKQGKNDERGSSGRGGFQCSLQRPLWAGSRLSYQQIKYMFCISTLLTYFCCKCSMFMSSKGSELISLMNVQLWTDLFQIFHHQKHQ